MQLEELVAETVQQVLEQTGFSGLPVDAQVAILNAVRRVLHEMGPFRSEPVDLVEWVPAGAVHGNDYNPNAVAPPEMRLLELSVTADGYTQPIVTAPEGASRVVVDGFHRTRVGKESEAVRGRCLGHLPVVAIQADRNGRCDRIAATIRHNRARGKHGVEAMSRIVMELHRRNWSEARIAKELGMEPDEVLRLRQMTGLAEMFRDREFSRAWTVEEAE